MKGKKFVVSKILSYLHNLVFSPRPLIVLEAPTAFHLEHFKAILKSLSDRNDLDIFLVSPDTSKLPKYKNIKYFSCERSLPLYRKAALFISTELNKIPHWFDCTTIYFGHGMGPKLDYAADKGLIAYDYTFSPCVPYYDIQTTILPQNKVIPVGLPILDNNSHKRDEIYSQFNLDVSKPLLVYGPSWCKDIEKISDIPQIISYLENQKKLNVIISAHPLLFDKNRCSGKVVFEDKTFQGNIRLNSNNSGYSTLDLVKASDIVLSDISSILYEAMALDKKVIFDGNREIYQYCEAMEIYEQVIKVCKTPNWKNESDNTINDVIEFDELSNSRQEFIDSYLFNRGIASEAFVSNIYKILKAAQK